MSPIKGDIYGIVKQRNFEKEVKPEQYKLFDVPQSLNMDMSYILDLDTSPT